MYCPKCGTNLADDAVFCPTCGIKVEKMRDKPKQTNEKTTQPNTQTQAKSTINNYKKPYPIKTYNGQIIASFVLGILSLVFWIISIFDLALSIVGLVLNRKSDICLNFGLRKAGFVLCLLGLIFAGIWTLLYIISAIVAITIW